MLTLTKFSSDEVQITTPNPSQHASSSQQEKDTRRRNHFEKLLEKHKKGIKLRIEETCSSSEWIYSWLFVDLQEWELTHRFKHGIHSRSQKEIWPPPDDHILKIREKLAFLQTRTVNRMIV
jgi:hypothetical protein